jgi:pyruvate dehydrogenase complex dehydrogenase (E1) component
MTIYGKTRTMAAAHLTRNIETETRITAIIRWNGLAIVVRATATCGELGGQVASSASATEIFEGPLEGPLMLSASWLMPDFWQTPTGSMGAA